MRQHFEIATKMTLLSARPRTINHSLLLVLFAIFSPLSLTHAACLTRHIEHKIEWNRNLCCWKWGLGWEVYIHGARCYRYK